jgi:hypothetical protein
MEIIEEIKPCMFMNDDDDETYDIDILAKHGFTVTPIHRGFFIFKEIDNVLYFCFMTEANGNYEGERFGNVFWHGYGMTGSLRELRHSYFVEYAFYIPTRFIRECCDIMDTYFDEC